MKDSIHAWTRQDLFSRIIIVFCVAAIMLLASCAASHDTARIPDLVTSSVTSRDMSVTRAAKSVTSGVESQAPVPPVNPTRQERKAYEKRLKSWEKVEVAKAKASAGPTKVKAKGGSSLAQPGGTSTNNYQAGKKAKDPVAVGEQAAADDHSTDARPTFWSGLGKSIPWVVLVLVVTLIGYVLRRLDII